MIFLKDFYKNQKDEFKNTLYHGQYVVVERVWALRSEIGNPRIQGLQLLSSETLVKLFS